MGVLADIIRALAVRGGEDVGERAAAHEAEQAAARAAARPVLRGSAAVQDLMARGMPPEALAVRPTQRALPAPVARKALPAPPKPLALPAPGPGLPEFAAKPQGGQWWIDKQFLGANPSPEQAARQLLPGGVAVAARDTPDAALRDWWLKALPRYLKNDFASPNDPLRSLAEQGLFHVPGVSPDEYSDLAKSAITKDTVQDIMFPRNAQGGMPGAGDDLRGESLAAMPWLGKLPSTQEVYGFSRGALDQLQFPHVLDEMRNALHPGESGIPADLAVRPESLGRMSFPQAVERVGRINEWRAKQAAQAGLSNLDSPAVHLFKDYPENNPMGLRWVELKAPDLGENLPEGYRIEEDPGAYLNSPGYAVYEGYKQIGTEMDPERARQFIRADYYRPALQDALRYEGDTMGHCVGGYCDDVLSGRSRIFSLRDAKGEPHVTIETAPGRAPIANKTEWQLGPMKTLGPEVQQAFDAYQNLPYSKVLELPGSKGFAEYIGAHAPEIAQQHPAYFSSPADIVQIKGKQNRAPNPEYLPFVQDFVKSGQWGDIGDFGNTGLVRLPDQRLIRQEDWDTGIRRAVADRNPQWSPERLNEIVNNSYSQPGGMVEDRWASDYAPYFEGFAVGGRVNQFAVRRAA